MTAPEDNTPETDAPSDAVDPELQRRLDEVASLPLSEQAEAYQQIHAELQQSLADIDAG